MTPLPWSHSALEDFVNCPRAFHAKRVAKTHKEEPTEQLLWGNRVHKAFELRIKDGTPLPAELEEHEEFLLRLATMTGEQHAERKIALDRRMQPCSFFDKEVWFRGVIDFTALRENHALVVDYKTGKPHSKFRQLKTNALHIFAEFPSVQSVDVRYYWTTTGTTTGEVYKREQAPAMWAEIAPDLKQYAQAFKTESFTPRQSGLCKGWCVVTECEFWGRKRAK